MQRLLKCEEDFWRQRAKLFWLKSGDLNSQAFHSYANGRAESVMGKAIKDLPRESIVISSKVFWPTMPGPNGRGLSRKHIIESVNASLKRMGVEYFDLYFCHRYDPDTPVEEVVRTMNDLIHQGKILYWGTSEWNAAQITKAYRAYVGID